MQNSVKVQCVEKPVFCVTTKLDFIKLKRINSRIAFPSFTVGRKLKKTSSAQQWNAENGNYTTETIYNNDIWMYDHVLSIPAILLCSQCYFLLVIMT